jgi:hypothetical protein
MREIPEIESSDSLCPGFHLSGIRVEEGLVAQVTVNSTIYLSPETQTHAL